MMEQDLHILNTEDQALVQTSPQGSAWRRLKRKFSAFVHALRYSQLKRRWQEGGGWARFSPYRPYAQRAGLIGSLGLGIYGLSLLAGGGFFEPESPNSRFTQYGGLGALVSQHDEPYYPQDKLPQKQSDKLILSKLNRLQPDLQLNYIKRFARVAKDEAERYGIPASVVLGLAILGSEFGTAEHARLGQNQTGILCSWNLLQESLSGQGEYEEGLCFTHYQTAWASFRANSMRLSQAQFAELQRSAGDNYLTWASGLDKLGFQAYNFSAATLIEVIETYELERYLRQEGSETKAKKTSRMG